MIKYIFNTNVNCSKSCFLCNRCFQFIILDCPFDFLQRLFTCNNYIVLKFFLEYMNNLFVFQTKYDKHNLVLKNIDAKRYILI